MPRYRANTEIKSNGFEETTSFLHIGSVSFPSLDNEMTPNTDLRSLALRHYENFPVGSFLLPRSLRKPVHLIYAYARVADDIADEGSESEAVRLEQLDRWEGLFLAALDGRESDEFFHDLATIVIEREIPQQLFLDLVMAFRMDARSTRYETFDDILSYCRHSANPIGRMLLRLCGDASEGSAALSDALCTALQLTNFWQDLSLDTNRDRLYIPREDFSRFGCSAGDLRRPVTPGSGMYKLIEFEVGRTHGLFDAGKILIESCPRPLRLEVALTWHGGTRVLEKIAALGFNTTQIRPTLSIGDKWRIFVRALLR
jgi:squalene synthase HpnC